MKAANEERAKNSRLEDTAISVEQPILSTAPSQGHRKWAAPFDETDEPSKRRRVCFSNGTKGPRCGQTGWCLGDYMGGDWMVTDFSIRRVGDYPQDESIAHPHVLAACEAADILKARLFCIILEAWPKVQGRVNFDDEQKNPQPGVKELFDVVFRGGHSYQLRIWFRAPYTSEKFEKQCLSFFTRYFEQRKTPHNDLYDADGVRIADNRSST